MQTSGKVLSLCVAAGMLLAPSYASGEQDGKTTTGKSYENEPAPAAVMADRDGNKVFDNLEKRMEKSAMSDKIPVIIQVDTTRMNGKASKAIEKRVGKYSLKHEYTHALKGIAATMTRAQIQKLQNVPFIKQIEEDVEMKAFNGTANYWTGTEKARTDFGLDGDRDGNPLSYSKDDIVVAVIDTGIDAGHRDLDNGKVIGWKDYVNGRTTPYDDQGHGTHVAGIAAGEGEANSTNKGVAPGAALVGIKVLDANGSGSMSDITAGVDWAVANKSTYGIEVLNLSLGSSGSSDGTDSTSAAVNAAVDAGLVVAVAAGNSGPRTYTVGAPGAAEKALTVGAMADPGENGFFLADFSSRGYTADGRIKPDIAAPGYNITAPQANTSASYVTYSGTSMATPFTAGTVALMLDANPSLTPSQVFSKLTATSVDWGPSGKDIDYGFGRLDGYESIKSAGGFTGTNISAPAHHKRSGSLGGSRAYDQFDLEVTNTAHPLAVTMIMPDWRSSWFSSTPDYDLYVYDPSGNIVARAEGTKRQETVSFKPSAAGTYTIEVYSYSGSGKYFFDVSAGAASLTQTVNQ